MRANRKVGILGGGQLARMLAEAASPLGLHSIIYTEDPHSPASGVCPDMRLGRIDEPEKLKAFLSEVDQVIFENEFVDCSSLRNATPDPKEKFLPPLEAIELLQDKLEQKKLLQRISIPSAPFFELENSHDAPFAPASVGRAKKQIQKAFQELASDIVLKWSKQGYDGKGVKTVARDNASELASAASFVEAAWSRSIRVYAEKKVDFVRELAIIGCVSITGEAVTYPLVISDQQKGICKEVIGPAIHLGVAAILEKQAQDAVRRISKEARLCGSFGIEFFETRSGELLVNEIAPRVHNSGHYTQNAFAVSQFENHWRAVLGLPLFDPSANLKSSAPFFAMLNLLGPEGVSRRADQSPLPTAGAHSELHWYGKAEIRPGRKLGHLNGTADSPEALSTLLQELKACESNWIKELSKS